MNFTLKFKLVNFLFKLKNKSRLSLENNIGAIIKLSYENKDNNSKMHVINSSCLFIGRYLDK